MQDHPFETVGLASDVIDLYSDSYNTLKAQYSIETTGDIDFHLEQFEIFKGCDMKVRGSYAIRNENNNDCYILFVETHSRVKTKAGMRDRYDHQTWAISFVKHDFGRVMIRRETLADKIIELMHPIELDFEDDKPFSDTFYVLVNDRNKAIRAINRNFRNAVMDIREDDFLIEIAEHTLIIGSRDPIMPGRAIYLAEFVSRMCAMC